MPDRGTYAQVLRFGPFEVDLAAGELRRGAESIRLQELPFRLLSLLLQHPGSLLTREELHAKLWPEGTYVDFDRGLNTAVRKVRQALDDVARRPRFVETVARRGYRLLVEPQPVLPRTGATGCMLAVRTGEVRGATEGALQRVLDDVIAATGGEEIAGRVEARLVTFHTPADAVRCAIAMQQAAAQQSEARSPVLRIGIEAGADAGVRALGLARSASPGEILCCESVQRALAPRGAFQFVEARTTHGRVERDATPAYAVVYDPTHPTILLARPPFVGRVSEARAFATRVARAQGAQGGLVLLAGEPGIGKTRALEELAERARRTGVRVIGGRCPHGEWTPPFAAFAEALADYARQATAPELSKHLGRSAGVVAKLVPGLREQLGHLPEPPPLRPNEERERVLDAVAQLVRSIARRETVLLVLDDLHWADAATVALLSLLARLAPSARLLVAGAYRDVDLDPESPFGRVLPALSRVEGMLQLKLGALSESDVKDLLETLSARSVPPEFTQAVHRETNGHPLFLRELLLHWVEQGILHRTEGVWTTDLEVEELGIPAGVRALIEQRLAHLSDDARRLLVAASACPAAFRFHVVHRAADLPEPRALDALDEVIAAQLVRPEREPDCYGFTHSLIRHALYTGMTTARQLRLHRRLAEEMERAFGENAALHAGEIAEQYHKSASLPGAERGVGYCTAAAERAEQAAALAEQAAFLRMAVGLAPPDDPRRTPMLARLARALAWSGSAEKAARVAEEAAARIAAGEGAAAAAAMLAEVADAIWWASFDPVAWRVAALGLRHAGDVHDLVWARLMAHDLSRRESTDPVNPGIALDTPERREVSLVVLADPRALELHHQNELWRFAIFSSRAAVLERARDAPHFTAFWAGELRSSLPRIRESAESALGRGQIGRAATLLAVVARIELALGRIAAAERSFAQASELTSRIPPSALVGLWLGAVPAELAIVRGEGLGALLPSYEYILSQAAPENQWAMALTRAGVALCYAEVGRVDDALSTVARVAKAIERAPGWSANYTLMVHLAVAALWTLGRSDHAAAMELQLREKTLAPDFRYPHADARLTLARLCALQGRHDEAAEWLAWARAVLDEQGARPLRALCDYDEAWMWLRRGAPGDVERAAPLLDAAVRQFESIGMMGWIRRVARLRRSRGETRLDRLPN